MKQLSALGLELSITGGIVPEEIHLFKEIKNAKAFIAGRALVGEKVNKPRKRFVLKLINIGRNI
ncbi:3-keto-L-gulonate-6-phosphate decarboxylase [Actinobacillus equuli]|nr:3-keto-L-gulonate-6-phosphate decarboxylase [Actinobacillus equuli]